MKHESNTGAGREGDIEHSTEIDQAVYIDLVSICMRFACQIWVSSFLGVSVSGWVDPSTS